MGKKKAEKTFNNTKEIVLSALKKLMKNTGWSAKTIVKFIKMEYNITDPNLGRKVSRALKRATKLGLIRSERNRYRLNQVSGLESVSSAHLRRRKCREKRLPRHRDRPLQIRKRTPSCACPNRKR